MSQLIEVYGEFIDPVQVRSVRVYQKTREVSVSKPIQVQVYWDLLIQGEWVDVRVEFQSRTDAETAMRNVAKRLNLYRSGV